jgi:arginine exporter protein ArgO
MKQDNGITKVDLFLHMQMVSEVHHLRAHKCTNTLSYSDQVLILLRSAGYGARPELTPILKNVLILQTYIFIAFYSIQNGTRMISNLREITEVKRLLR